jgi:hypothetical protein
MASNVLIKKGNTAVSFDKKSNLAEYIELCREDCAAFCEFILQDETTGDPVENTENHNYWHETADSEKRMIIWSHPESGKGLHLDTKIPTPEGYKKISDLKVGDSIFGEDGKVCKITFISNISHRQGYKITWNDGSVTTADDVHRWKSREIGTEDWKTVDTQHIVDSGHLGWEVPLCDPIQYPETELPIDPFWFGVWLAIGKPSNLKIKLDSKQKYLDYIKTLDTSKYKITLKNLGILKNKHIPEIFIRSSVAQRQALLTGLLEAKGKPNKYSGSVVYVTKDKLVSKGVVEIARSLGGFAYYRVVDEKYEITINTNFSLFVDPLKGLQQQRPIQKTLKTKKIHSIEKLGTIKTKCLEVDNESHTFVCGKGYTVTHNTQQLAIGRILWLLGRDPRKRYAILSATKDQAKKIINAISDHIERNPRLKLVFPDLEKGGTWTDHDITIKRPGQIKDPSVQAYGCNTAIQGSRLDGLILDDVLIEENTRTAYQRDKLKKWVKRSAFSRLSRDAWIIFLANAWHPEDFAHELAAEGWWNKKYPVLDANDNPTWPQRWPYERIKNVRDTLYGAEEFTRVMMCEPRDDSSARFQKEWIDRCKDLGRGYRLYHNLTDLYTSELDLREKIFAEVIDDHIELGPGYYTITGVDLGVSTKAGADQTVIFTILLYPGGTKQVVNIKSGRMTAPEIIRNIIDTHLSWNSDVVIETVAAQDFIRQWAMQESHGLDIPLIPFKTGRNKLDPKYGVESVGVDLEKGRWVIPCDIDSMQTEKEVTKWVAGMLYYSPDAHTSDHLMASWFCREYARIRYSTDGRKSQNRASMRVIG